MTPIRVRFSFGHLIAVIGFFMMACTDYGGFGCNAHCDHAWDGLPGSCAKTPAVPAGTIGGECYGAADPTGALCVDGGRCIDGVCIACGTNTLTCCDDGRGNGVCNDGSTCAQSTNLGTCDATCGTLNPGTNNCCAGDSCGAGSVCVINSGKCVAAGPVACSNPNDQKYTVVFLDHAKCMTTSWTFNAANDTAAQQCATSFQTANAFAGTCGLHVASTLKEFCATTFFNGPDPTAATVCANATTADITACEQEQCAGCTITPTNSIGLCD